MSTISQDLSRAIGLHQQGRLHDAIPIYQSILTRDPVHADAWHLVGVIAHQVGRHDEAAQHISRALQVDPENPEFWNNLAAVWLALGRPETAQECCLHALQRRPDFAEAHNHLGLALRQLGRVPDAIAAYRRALELRPEGAAFHANLAAAYQEQGELELALSHYELSLKLNPQNTSTYFNLSEWVQRGRYSFTQAQLAHIERLLQSPNLPLQSAIQLCFAAARTLDGRGDFARAFAYFSRGNALRAVLLAQNHIRFDCLQHADYVARIIATFGQAYFAEMGQSGIASEVPVFIVGMPRSGTTLVEQILASHPAMFGAGERDAIPQLARTLSAQLGCRADYPECLRSAEPSGLRRIAQSQLDSLQRLAPKAARVTDKLPGNIVHLGLIATLFPRARVIHCRRHALDVCLSCFTQNFQAHEVAAFCCSLDSLAVYFHEYDRLAQHWAAVLPLPMFELQYEDLVRSPDQVIRQLVAFCGVPWDDRCIEFHRTQRTVRTASSLQVRDPIFGSSLGRWKHYVRELEPLRCALNIEGVGPVQAAKESPTKPESYAGPLP